MEIMDDYYFTKDEYDAITQELVLQDKVSFPVDRNYASEKLENWIFQTSRYLL
jgi:hypothetical protein